MPSAEKRRLAGRVTRRALSEGELRWAYENSAGLLYTTRWEGFGIPVLEAFACGIPVVSTRIGAEGPAPSNSLASASLCAKPGEVDALAQE